MGLASTPVVRSVLRNPRIRPFVQRAKPWLPEPMAPQHPIREIRKGHPRFVDAVLADARAYSLMRGRHLHLEDDREALVAMAFRLCWSTDAFFALVCYRGKARLQQLGVPVVPRILHKMAMSSAQVCIGDPVVIQPGIYLPHGQVVIDGIVTIDQGTSIRPWVTIGLKEGDYKGATIKGGVRIGTGAKVVGPVIIGAGAIVGANAIVTRDVPTRTTVAGVPARVLDK